MKSKAVVSIWSAGVCAVFLTGILSATGTEVKTRAISDMFYKDTLTKPVTPKPATAKISAPSPAPQPAPSRRRVGLKYRIQIQSTSGGAAVDTDPLRTFRSGEAIRLLVESNIDGYLYILQKGSSGREAMLFPSPEINGGSNWVKAGEPLTVPWNGFFKFDSVAGKDKLLLVVSRSPLDVAAPAKEKPDAEPAEPMKILMAELGRSVRSRDLVFVKEETPAPAGSQPAQQAILWVNKNASDSNQAVYATVELNHQ